MTVNVPDFSNIIPSKAKAWVGLIGSGLTFAVPYALTYAADAPPWVSLVLGIVLFIATGLGVYKAPYKPTGTVLVPAESPLDYPAASEQLDTQPRGYGEPITHPWKN